MLSYQHIYHAGCLADVHKHMALVAVLQNLLACKKPLTYIETHAGRGLYDLSAPEAEKTGEAKEGILRILAQKRLAENNPYLQILEKTKSKYGTNAYPGSPMIAQMMLRSMDLLHLYELHPREFAALQEAMHGRNVSVRYQDGYAGAMAISPPVTEHGLVLIDPSFEVKMEYEKAAIFVKNMYKTWKKAVILLWYPMLKSGYYDAMAEYLEEENLPGFYRHEVRFADPEEVRGMFGTGLLAVNLPPEVIPMLDGMAGMLQG